ncbi:hypothetical protein TSOC_001089 [Tetrabaena socialis]|uniref:Uncharacterized protein n=1 Tax=Tetrabaena socialis TaxID=47790 RepID=A0A2J8AHQ4_9CHLO|nr:hypothetical protein TSOC_001089 [Tetrabaena socialis]|eukprot:PNH12053.1 hypothetical protein TSOC_001089 [Tetrabaena socialis]
MRRAPTQLAPLLLGRMSSTAATTAPREAPAESSATALRQQPQQPQQHDSAASYEACLGLARSRHFDDAARSFEAFLGEQPRHHKGWISYAQMSKKRFPDAPSLAHEACRSVLDRGLSANPEAAQLWQARGLLELQAGNAGAARGLLERAVALDPALAPVLKWKALEAAGARSNAEG